MPFQLSDNGQAMIHWPRATWRVHPSGFGWDFDNSENQVTIRLTSQQSGWTSWGILLTDVDGLVRYKGGLSRWDDTGKEIHEALIVLMLEARWSAELINEWREPDGVGVAGK